MKRKILFVDDDPSLLATMGDFLEFEGYDVLKAESGEEALSILRDTSPDLIVLDMSMPGIGGVGVLDRIMLPDGKFRFPVLVLTARAQMAEFFADKQVDGFLAKPCAPEDLSLEISRIIFQTAGAPADEGRTFGLKPLAYLADSNTARRSVLSTALADAGYDVETFPTGTALVEGTMLRQPAFILMALHLSDENADAVAGLLASMKSLASLHIVVYGAALAGITPQQRAALEAAGARIVFGTGEKEVIGALADLLRPKA